MRNAARYLDLGLGHSATLEPSDRGGVLWIRGPRGTVPVAVDIVMTEQGPSVRLRDTILYGAPSPSLPAPSQRPPASDDARAGAPAAPGPSTLSVPAAPVATAPSREPRLSVQQFATLRAACMNATPAMIAQALARFSLDEATDAAESGAWARKFEQDPALFDSYRHYFQLARSTAARTTTQPSPQPSAPPGPPSKAPPSAAVPSTHVLLRVMTLGQHATMAAELVHGQADAVYAKYGIADPKVRAQVLGICEDRLKDPQMMETWKKLYALALQKVEAASK